MEPVKILHVIDSLGRRGGAERQLANEIGALSPESFTSYVCYLHPPAYLQTSLQKMGVLTCAIGVKGMKQWPIGVRRLRRLIKELQPDLIHTSLYESDVIGGLAGRLTGIPVVSTLTNSLYEPEWMLDNPNLNRFKLALSRFIKGFIVRRCNRHVVAVSEAIKASAVRQLGLSPDKITVIHRSLSPEWLTDAPPDLADSTPTDKLPSGTPILINTGRLEPQKGQRYIIEAMPAILKHLPQAILLIVGEGSLRPQFTRLTEQLGVQDHVVFLGQRSDVRRLLEASDIFVFPSLYEGCPNALIEAMAVGLPSVAAAIEPVAEVTRAGRFAHLAPPADASAMAQGVIRLATDPVTAQQMGSEARISTRNFFTIARVAAQRTLVYQGCVNARSAPQWNTR